MTHNLIAEIGKHKTNGERMDFDLFILLNVILSSVVFILAFLSFRLQKRSSKIHHMMPTLDRIFRVINDIRSFSSDARFLKMSIPELQKQIKQADLTKLPFFNMFTFSSLFGIQSVFKLNKACSEIVDMFKDLKKEGSLERLQRIDRSLSWQLHELHEASLKFLELDIMPLTKATNITEGHIQSLIDKIDESVVALQNKSNKCLDGLKRLTP